MSVIPEEAYYVVVLLKVKFSLQLCHSLHSFPYYIIATLGITSEVVVGNIGNGNSSFDVHYVRNDHVVVST